MFRILFGISDIFRSSMCDNTLDNLIKGGLKVSELQTSNVGTVLQSIRYNSQIFLEQNWNEFKGIIRFLYDEYYMNSKLRSEIRWWSICFVDKTLFS